MTTSQQARPVAEDIDLHTLGRALWRAKGWIVGLAIGAGAITFIALSMMRPLFTSEARILIQNDESAFTRPTAEQGRDWQQRALDEQAVQSQVQVLTSRDLAVQVINDLNLTDNAGFLRDAGTGLIRRLFTSLGLGRRSAQSEEENAANAFAEHLSVFQLSKSSVIAIEYTSGDSNLAAKIANQLADVYIAWQREAKLAQTKDATAWLSSQIEVLRKRVAEAEAAAEQFRAQQGLFAGTNNVTLNAQQLSELNSQLILANAQKSEAEARARLIKKMLADKSDINATPEVLKSELIARLIDQRVQVQRQLAELSATLLPSHPRIKQLASELADVRAQIRTEAVNIVKGLENEAQIASAREMSLRKSLNDVKTQASGLSEAEIKLRALEREAKAQRDLLESYLARYRDASARHDMGAVPAQATIVSRAHASILPSFPKRSPLSLLAAVATALLALAYVLARELIGAPAVERRPAHQMAREGMAPGPQPARPAVPAMTEAELRRASEPRVAANAEAPAAQPELPLAQTAGKRWLPRSAELLPPRRVEQNTQRSSKSGDAATSALGARAPETAISPPSAEGLLHRLRRGLASSASESQAAASAPPKSLLERIRDRRAGAGKDSDAGPTTIAAEASSGSVMPVLKTNDLRHYLRRLGGSKAEAANDPHRKEKGADAGSAKVGPVLKSLDAVVNHLLAAGRGEAPRALLVAGAADKVDATRDAIAIARALVGRRERVVLVDLTRGPTAISGPLGLPRAPGLTDLTAGRCGFGDVVKIDAETPLQVIAAGNPKLASGVDENERFPRVLEALMQTYDSVVLHADREALRKLTPALRFELPIVVAVLPVGAIAKNGDTDLADFSALGCPVLLYEQNDREPRSRLFGRVAAY